MVNLDIKAVADKIEMVTKVDYFGTVGYSVVFNDCDIPASCNGAYIKDMVVEQKTPTGKWTKVWFIVKSNKESAISENITKKAQDILNQISELLNMDVETLPKRGVFL